MFGIKIITKSEYSRLLEAYMKSRDEANPFERKRLENDIASLREQNGELRQELNILREFSNFGLPDLKDYIVLRADSYPCEKCRLESDDCKKLVFAEQTICICRKDKVNRFNKSKKK